MGLIQRIKAKRQYLIKKKRYQSFQRRQFNVVISEGIVKGIRHLAAKLETPRFALTEHLLQVGVFHLVRSIEDREKILRLQNHLTKTHLLRKGTGDSERLLKLGCDRTYIEEFLPVAARAFKSLELLNEGLSAVIERNCSKEDKDGIKKLRDDSMGTMFELIIWMERLKAMIISAQDKPLAQHEDEQGKP